MKVPKIAVVDSIVGSFALWEKNESDVVPVTAAGRVSVSSAHWERRHTLVLCDTNGGVDEVEITGREHAALARTEAAYGSQVECEERLAERRIVSDSAISDAVTQDGVPVSRISRALGISRLSVYEAISRHKRRAALNLIREEQQ